MKTLIPLLAMILNLPTGLSAAASGPSPSPSVEITRVERSRASGTPRLVIFAAGNKATAPAPSARRFLAEHGAIFGITDAAAELRRSRVVVDRMGQRHTTFEQFHRGVPVLGGVLRVHQDRGGRVRVVNGLFVPGITVGTEPAITTDRAEEIAFGDVARDVSAFDLPWLEARTPNLLVLRTGLTRGLPGADHLVWDVEVSDGAAVREFVAVDAHSGKIVDRVTGILSIDREVHEQTFGNPVWREGDDFPYDSGDPDGDAEVNELIRSASDVYTLFAYLSNGDYVSYDGDDASMVAVRDISYDDCPNAFWNGRSTNFCLGMAVDDIIAHEWTHAYTGATHGLLYTYQPGALNESFSDIFGEIADRLNDRGTDSPDIQRINGACPWVDPSLRWQIGEDSIIGTFRDMWNPACYRDPGRIGDGRYYCGSLDAGGVHTNSGIPNHAFALATDGGIYNFTEIDGIGLIKAAHIWWRAMSIYQAPTTDFPAHADLIELSCADLIGADLTDLSTGVPGLERITADDCDRVALAMQAVEMRQPPVQCDYQPLLASPAPDLPPYPPLFDEPFTNDVIGDGWTVTNMGVYSEYDARDWVWVDDPPTGGGGDGAVFAIDSVTIGDCIPGSDDQAGVMNLDSPPIPLPANRQSLLVLDHYVATEARWDGGLVQVSVDGGPFVDLPFDAFAFNAYPNMLMTAGEGNDNPLAGRWAFTGADGGSVRGSWGQSQISLASVADPGSTIVLRFAFGVDGCNGLDGWYLDRVRIIPDSAGPRRPDGGRSGG